MKSARIQTHWIFLMALGVPILLGPASRELVGNEKPASPLPPAEELKTFRLADPNLTVELVAAEPAVISPVAVAWDDDGGMYVAEMSDYPLGPPGGRVKRLTEPNDQGTYRKASVIAERLPFPNGVLPYKGGVLVTAAPNIWHFPEAGGQGRIVLSGFAEGNQQLRVNGLYWGLDNWVYGANGRSHGTLRKPEDAAGKGISLNRRDFRFHPDNSEAEALAGFSQFGLAQDDWGNRFLSWNTQPFRQAVLEERYLNRNPYLAAAASVASLSDPADQGRLFPIGPPPTTFNREPVEYFNASCGHTIYRGDALPAAYRGNLFVCEPLTSLVHRRELVPAGVTFVARRTEPGQEFFAATDPWCHPVNLSTGPDGALYVVDFYRQWVEHPQYVPENIRKQIDWRKGSEHGRIWRIRPKDATRPAEPRLRDETTTELVRHLGHTNGWVRDTAQRLLVERQDKQALPLLKDTVRSAPLAPARIHALWTLEALGGLDEPILLHALRDEHPRVREHAVRLSEGRLAGSAPLQEAVMGQLEHDDIRVRFQTALALGELSGTAHLTGLARLVQRDGGDEWMRLAVLCGLKETAWPFAQQLLDQDRSRLRAPSEGQLQFLTLLGAVIGGRNRDAELSACLQRLAQGQAEETGAEQLGLLSGLAEGLQRAGRPLRTLLVQPPAKLETSLRGLQPILRRAQQLATSDQLPAGPRVPAIQVLARVQPDVLGALLLNLLKPEQPRAVQSAAARSLAEIGDQALAGRVLDTWATLTTGTRGQLLASLLRSSDLAGVLITALEQGKLAAAELDPASRETLRRIPNKDLQRRAGAVLAKVTTTNRQEVLQRYQPALRLTAERQRGAAVFAKHCLACHQLQGQGHRVGPDLSGVASRPKEALLEDILDPNKNVAPDFLNYVLVTARGEVLTGLLTAETATTVKLRYAEGVEDVVLRSEIQEQRSTGKSLMPEGLEQVLNLQDIADLIEFLQWPGPLPAADGKK